MSATAPEVGGSLSVETGEGSIEGVDMRVGGWTPVPTALMNDERLSLDTRGFAGWLLARPKGWQIRLSLLPWLLSTNQQRFGRQKARRFIRELKSAGYLDRSRWRAPNGQWIWDYRFRPQPQLAKGHASIDERQTRGGLPTGGSLTGRSATGGQATDIIQIPNSSNAEQFLNRTTTTPPVRQHSDADVLAEIRYPDGLTGKGLASARKLMKRCPPNEAQPVLDELAAMMRQGRAPHPIGLLKTLVERATIGEFVPNRSLERSGPSRSVPEPAPSKTGEQVRQVSDAAQKVILSLQAKFGTDS